MKKAKQKTYKDGIREAYDFIYTELGAGEAVRDTVQRFRAKFFPERKAKTKITRMTNKY